MDNNHNNLYEILADSPKDKYTGVKLARISGRGSVCFFALELESEAVLKAHYHLKGDETYYVLEGNYSMLLSKTVNVDKPIVEKSIQIQKGDVVVIEENVVHSLHNGNSISRLIIVCPEDHTGSDRYFTEDYDEKM